MQPTVRAARRSDVPAIVALLADDALGAAREDVSDPLHDEYWLAFDAVERDPNQQLVVAEVEGEVVATLQLTVIPYLSRRGALRGQIEAVRVANGRRGAGLGGELVAWAVEEARSRGCRIVQLTSDKRRADALRFYERHGFVATHVGMKLDLEA